MPEAIKLTMSWLIELGWQWGKAKAKVQWVNEQPIAVSCRARLGKYEPDLENEQPIAVSCRARLGKYEPDLENEQPIAVSCRARLGSARDVCTFDFSVAVRA